MNKKNIFTNFHIIIVLLIVKSMCSCSDNIATDERYNNETSVLPLVEWDMTISDVKTRMNGFNVLSSTNDCLLYSNVDNPERSYAFQFQNGLLSASTIITPDSNLSSYVKEYTHLGFLGKNDVYANTNLNTIITLCSAIEADGKLCAVGFLPISSPAYEVFPLPEVTTNEAVIVDYSSAEVFGTVNNLMPGDTYGIIFGNKANLSDGIKLSSIEGESFSFTLNQMEIGKTYYYCAYIDAGDITYYGQTLSFTMPSPNFNVNTGEAENVTSYTATISGSVNVSLQYDIDYDYGFFLSTSGVPSKDNHVIEAKPEKIQAQKFTAELNNLKDNITYYYCAYVLCQGIYFYGNTKNFSTPKATRGKLNGHEWVDLGLPSGLKWATCNIGATSPEEYGGYYAWGETSTKNFYSADNYPYGNTKDHSYNIPYDISGTSYDVAQQWWGSTWQMPTFSDIKELYYNCSFSWEYLNGISGARMTGKNGNSIFLPAGGAIGPGYTGSGGTKVVGSGERGRYWSATMAYKQNWNEVKYLNFDKKGISLSMEFLGSYYDININGFNGMLVRPVTK